MNYDTEETLLFIAAMLCIFGPLLICVYLIAS